MTEVRIERSTDGTTGRCVFCWRRQEAPEAVQALVYMDGEPFGGLACAECLSLDEAALRERIRETAAFLTDMAEELKAAAGGPIRRPAAGVLELERLLDLPSPVIVDRLV